MKYSIGHYGMVCHPDYRYEKETTTWESESDVVLDEKGYYITFDEGIVAGNITYDKGVITDGEAKEILKDYMERRIAERIDLLQSCLSFVEGM